MNVFFPPLHRSRCLLTVLVTLLLCLPLLSSGQPAQAAPVQVRLRGHVPVAALAHARAMGRVPRSETLSLALTLPLRDSVGLQTLLERLYTPGDPLYGHYLTPQEFTNRFGPTQQSYEAVIAFARSQGLTITHTHPNHLLVDVSGPAATVESAFSIHLQRYAAVNGRIFHAPDTEPAIPAALIGRLSGVIGLENSSVHHSYLRRRAPMLPSVLNPILEPRFTPEEIGTDPNTGALSPSDIKAAYNLSNTKLTAAGQTLALLELDTYTPSDISAYENAFRLPNVPLENVPVDASDPNFPTSPGAGAGEVTLDIEVMTALAPGAAKILVYEGPNTDQAFLDIFNQIATDDRAKEVSCSWGQPENGLTPAVREAENTIFKQMAGLGQSVFSASGDSGAYDDGGSLSVDDPASQPFMVGVGGTTLSVVAPGRGYQSESAWGTPSDTRRSPSGAGGGGGISTVWPLPDYQTGVGLSATQRNVPDVSLDADPNTGYSFYLDGQWNITGGTSVAAPLWAAFTALVNQQRASNGEGNLGFANKQIYQIGKNAAQYAAGFHDVTAGDNLFYPATAGYDNATGWGSFNGANLLALLAPTIDTTPNSILSLTLTPNSVVGGGPVPVNGTVTLANAAPAGATVTLSTSNAAAAPISQSVIVLSAGQDSLSFTINTAIVTAQTPVTITAVYHDANGSAVLTANLLVTPAPPIITPLLLTLSPASVSGGDISTATLTLTGASPPSGLSVTLSSSDPAARPPASVIIPAGAVSASFTVLTHQVPTQVVATLTASVNGGTATGTLTVLPPTLQKLVLTPDHLPGGQKSMGSLALTSPAPNGGADVTLSSDNPAAQVPATFTIPAGATTTNFPIMTSPVSTTVTATIKATYGGLSQTAKLIVQSPRILTLSVAPASVAGGASSTGTVTLDSPISVAAGLAVTLSESSMVATIPATVTVPQGAVTATFPITTIPTVSGAADTITATLGSLSQTAVLTIQPIQVTKLTLSPSQVILGTPSQGTVTLSSAAPAGGLAVTLSSQGAAEILPASALVPAGATSVTFPIATPVPGLATLSAVVGGQTRTAILTVTVAPGTSYPAGLSMISSPYDYSGQPLAAVFGVAGAKLAVWQPGLGAYALTPNAPADTMRLGQGYWVSLAKAITLAAAGTPADPKTDFPITLPAGWNQVGDPFLVPITLSSLHVSSGSTTATFAQAASTAPLMVSGLVYGYSPSLATAKKYPYVLIPSDGALQPGAGYWVYAYQPVTLIVPHPGP